MQVYYAVIDSKVVALTWAEDLDVANDQIEAALAEEGILETDEMTLTRFRSRDGTIVLDPTDF